MHWAFGIDRTGMSFGRHARIQTTRRRALVGASPTIHRARVTVRTIASGAHSMVDLSIW